MLWLVPDAVEHTKADSERVWRQPKIEGRGFITAEKAKGSMQEGEKEDGTHWAVS